MGLERDVWERLHADPRYCPSYPQDVVVRWVFRTFPRSRSSEYRILDVGCGAGRHTVFLAREGYRVSACDVSTEGVHVTRKRLHQQNAQAACTVCEADALDYPSESFDGIVCYGVLYYLPFDRYSLAVRELRRVLKPGGQALVVTRTPEDSRCLSAERVGEHTFRLGSLPEGAPSNVEEAMTMTFLDHAAVRRSFADFESVSIDRITMTSGGGSFVDDDWIVCAARGPDTASQLLR